MRTTGMTRRIDPLGRVVLPSELRRTMGLEDGTFVEVLVEDDRIILRKYERGCCGCGAVMDDSVPFRKLEFCRDCLDDIKKL